MIIRPSALGDVCRTVPVLVSLKRRYPDAAIDWLVQDGFAPAVMAHPDLSQVVLFPRSRVAIRRLWRSSATRELFGLLRSLRQADYDVVYDCQGLGRSGFFARATGARERFGYAGAREFGWLGVNRRVRVPEGLHSVDRMLALVEGSGVTAIRDMRLYTSRGDRSSLDSRLRGSRYVLIAPTSRWPGKQWPAERFVAVIERLLADRVVDQAAIVGTVSEREQIGPVLALAEREPRVIDLVGGTRVGTLMAAVEGAQLVIANDSAALHMAVGFDRPMIGLYGPTRVDLVGPYGRAADVIQAVQPGPRNLHKDPAEGRRAMEAIDTKRVIDAALARLEARPGAARVGVGTEQDDRLS